MSDPLTPERPRVKIPRPQFCACTDPGCPVCAGHCRQLARQTVFRSDMEDETGTSVCDACAEDCLASGVFYTQESVASLIVDRLISEQDPTHYLARIQRCVEKLKPRAHVKVSPWEQRAGHKVEKEHATDNNTADTIASHHHKERKDYYRKLRDAGLADELEGFKV